MIVPSLAGDRICGVTRFLDDALLPRFGLPATLPATGADHGQPDKTGEELKA